MVENSKAVSDDFEEEGVEVSLGIGIIEAEKYVNALDGLLERLSNASDPAIRTLLLREAESFARRLASLAVEIHGDLIDAYFADRGGQN
jgi:hypothetical protein